MKKRLIVLLSLMMISCGFEIYAPDKLLFLYTDVQSCTGMVAPFPTVIKVKAEAWDDDDTRGEYFHITETVFLHEDKATDDTAKHEFIHHLLWKNKGDPDSDHNSRYFVKCSNDPGDGQ